MFNRVTLALFVVFLVLNSFLTTIIYSIGLSTGYKGEPSWEWSQYVNTLKGLFGDLGSLFALVGGIALIIIAMALAGLFAHRQNVVGSIIWYIIGIVGGGFLLFKVVDWSGFGFNFWPVIALVAFTAIEVFISRLIRETA